ncbi:MAG: rhamnogalacturonan acetylesterase [Victivallales bacterium]
MKNYLPYCFLLFAMNLPLSALDIYLAGDSTMAGYPPQSAPQAGWGQVFEDFCKKGVNVYNYAKGGRSSKSFRSEKIWDMIMEKIQPGDFVLIQFGHNDAHTGEKNLYRFADPEKVFPANLKSYVEDVRKKGAVPVLLTPTPLCKFRDGKVWNPRKLPQYIEAVRKVATEKNVDLIDINAWGIKRLTELGETKALKLYMNLSPGEFPNYPNGRKDTTHFSLTGARFIASGIVEITKKQNLELGKLLK